MRMLIRSSLVAVMAFGLAACDSLPKTDKQEAKQVERTLAGFSDSLKAQRAEFAQAQQETGWDFYNEYASREDWAGKLDSAEASIASMNARYDSNVGPLLKQDKSAGSAALQQQLDGIQGNFDAIRTEISYVEDRMKLLRTGYENADTWLILSRDNAEETQAIPVDLASKMQRASEAFPERAADIQTRYAPLAKMLEETDAALTVVEAEYATHENRGEADYAAFADAYTTINDNLAAAKKFDGEYNAQLDSLYEEYSNVLSDMRVEYWLKPRQETWCDYVDCRTNINDYSWESISKADYEKYANADKIADSFIQSLGINPKSGLGGSRGGYTWYASDAEPRYFHKYKRISGGVETIGEWEAVDEEDFAAYVDAFGMAIETKKVGMFADEAVNEATPLGAEMVGDSRYGRWETDSQGRDRWSFLEMYAVYHLVTGGNTRHYYYRSDYDSYRGWRRDRRAGTGTYGWYGANRSRPTYGSNGSLTRSSASYQSTSFGRGGGTNNVSTSVRNAGANARSRGPGGRGK